MTSFATGVTAHALTVALPEPAPELPEAVLVADELADPVVQPPTANAATSTTHGDHRREPRAYSDSVISAPCIAITTTGNISASSRQPAFTSPERSEAAAGRESLGLVSAQDCPGIWKFRRAARRAGRRTGVRRVRFVVPDGRVLVSRRIGDAAGHGLLAARPGRATAAGPGAADRKRVRRES
jgi:hypothetical protein